MRIPFYLIAVYTGVGLSERGVELLLDKPASRDKNTRSTDSPNLSCPFDSLPDAEVADDPCEEKAECQLPANYARLSKTRRYLQNISPVISNNEMITDFAVVQACPGFSCRKFTIGHLA